MLKRHVDGEPEEFARLRGSILTLCDREHFNRVMNILKEDAKEKGITMIRALYIWERSKCADLTTKSGMHEYNRVYNRELSVLEQ